MKQRISIIIPNYNGGRTLGTCLDSIFAISDEDREVIVVDDCSEDGSRDIVRMYPCRLVQMKQHAGASAARNAGALNGKGEVLFFIDADCVLQQDSLSIIRSCFKEYAPETVFGGTYSWAPYDPGFFNAFQSGFVHYFETKNAGAPDYLATHALAISAETFRKVGGFTEGFLPILEDVEFSHRLRRSGHRLVMIPGLQVRHIFNFSLGRSLKNAVRKTRYWIEYSMAHKDLFADSGTASREIKINGMVWLANAVLTLLLLLSGKQWLLTPILALWGAGIFVNRHLFGAFFRAGGAGFAVMAALYYSVVYPSAVWIGAFGGFAQHVRGAGRSGRGWFRRAA